MRKNKEKKGLLMAHLNCHHSIAAKDFRKEVYSNKIQFYDHLSFAKRNITLKKKKGLVCCCNFSSSADSKLNLGPDELERNEKPRLGYLVRDSDWQVRRMAVTEDETRRVAYVQAEAFHEPVFVFNDMFFDFFKAEVLSGLIYRLRNSAPDRYACLVAEPKRDSESSDIKEVVGVVDVTVQREYSVLEHLPGVQEYLYVSGIAVLNTFRRQKVATVLLKACDALCAMWGYEYLVLRAYEDDDGARKLYTNAGYEVVSRDPPWITIWIGRRRRVVMVKRSTYSVK